MNVESFRSSFPVTTSETVLEGHARACAQYGHAVWIHDGATLPYCPRCGESVPADPSTGTHQ